MGWVENREGLKEHVKRQCEARFANVLSNTPRVILQTSGFLSYPAVNL
jgi:hypothetical protein